jgi:hypothetical protein
MGQLRASKMHVAIFQQTWGNIPGDLELQQHRYKNIKSPYENCLYLIASAAADMCQE